MYNQNNEILNIERSMIMGMPGHGEQGSGWPPPIQDIRRDVRGNMYGLVHQPSSRRVSNQDNEDSYMLASTAKFVAVADGMGGYGEGKAASINVLAAVNRGFKSLLEQGRRIDADTVTEVFNLGHFAINNTASPNTNSGTTLTLAIFDHNGDLVLANSGDSRSTLVTTEGAVIKTSDECSYFSDEDALPPHVVFGGLVAGHEFQPPTITRVPARLITPGSVLALTTDGIHGDRPNEHINVEQIVRDNRKNTCQQIAQALLDAAIKDDDRTALVTRLL